MTRYGLKWGSQHGQIDGVRKGLLWRGQASGWGGGVGGGGGGGSEGEVRIQDWIIVTLWSGHVVLKCAISGCRSSKVGIWR
ncbi:hypothetical protein KO13_14595, partial [Listeria monocytogenes]